MTDLVEPRRARLWWALAAELVMWGILFAGRRGMPWAGAACWSAAVYAAARASEAKRRRDGGADVLEWDGPPAGKITPGAGFEVTPRDTEVWMALGRVVHDVARECVLEISEDLLDGHALLIGAPGTGKTRGMELIMVSAIRRGDAVVVLDPKGDAGLWDRAAEEAGGRFRLVSPAHPCASSAYNPLGHYVQVRELADRIAALLPVHGEGEAFRAFAWEAVFVCAQAMLRAGIPVTLARLRDYVLDGVPALAQVCAQRIPDTEEAQAVAALARRPAEHYAKTVAGLMPLLAKLTAGPNRRLFSPEPGEPALTWDEVDAGGLVVYFGLSALLGGDSAASLARMALADVLSYIGARYAYGSGPRRFWLFVDEAGDVATPEFVAALNKARGAGVTIVAAAQSAADFAAAMGSQARERQVRANVATLVRFGTTDGEEAEEFARAAGRKPVRVIEESRTYEPSFFGSGFRGVDDFRAQFSQRFRLAEAPLVPAWAVMELPRMHAFVRTAGRLYKIRVPRLRPARNSASARVREG